MRQELLANLEALARKAHYNAREFAVLCAMSPRQIQRMFREQFHCTPQHWLDGKRISAAQPLLLAGNSVKVVASELGFKQPSHFCRIFKLLTRTTPSKFVSAQAKLHNAL
jgi:transcriptional regulator GlxA family with amidase domain